MSIDRLIVKPTDVPAVMARKPMPNMWSNLNNSIKPSIDRDLVSARDLDYSESSAEDDGYADGAVDWKTESTKLINPAG